MASFSMNFWWPFLPLYVGELGVDSDAEALFWVGLATAIQGISRLVTGPVWGVLADRYGRKLMFARSLFAATLTTVIAAAATEPWHIVLALSAQGLLSGFIPAAIALTSVSVPDSQLNRSLGTVTGGQYLGGMLGPSAGALLAAAVGYRWAIIAAALLPSIAACWVLLAVPRDRISRTIAAAPAASRRWLRPRRPDMSGFAPGFYVAIFLYFGLFTLNQFVRVVTPIALRDLGGADSARAAAGVAFSLSGAAAVVGVLGVARFASARWPLARSLAVFCLLSALLHPFLGLAATIPAFVAVFTLVSLLNGAAMPSSNTLIAVAADPSVRGTAFGIASSAQAAAFIVGPMASAGAAAWSLEGGFLVVAVCFAGLALMMALAPQPRPRSGLAEAVGG